MEIHIPIIFIKKNGHKHKFQDISIQKQSENTIPGLEIHVYLNENVFLTILSPSSQSMTHTEWLLTIIV